jgi:DNA-binding winged helix-turn-helix (wHTH) protein
MDNPDLSNLLPYVTVTAPDRQVQRVQLSEATYTIGRLPGMNSICLLDEEGVISRIHHCVLERKPEGWWLTDKSTNGTTVKREGQSVQLADQPGRKLLIASEDIIRIHTWQIEFVDPAKTRPAKLQLMRAASAVGGRSGHQWVFNINEQKLYKVVAGMRQEMSLRPLVRVCLNYMVNKNREMKQPTLCGREELIGVVWKEGEAGHDEGLNGLARDIRKTLGQTKESFQWLETVTGAGYILRIDHEGSLEKF